MALTKKNPAAVALGRKGGKKGGPARAAKLTPAQRSESARKAVQARWAKAKSGSDDEATPAVADTSDRKEGGPARAAKLTPAQRSESARKAVQARWAKAKSGSDDEATPAVADT